MATAVTSTTPTTMSCDGESILSSTMPERSDCMMTAPSTAPGMVPMPPENDVPPMTAAEMTSSSFCTPRLVTAALSRAVWTAALTAHSTPIRTNVSMIVRRVLMPPSSAAFGLPPYGVHVAAEAPAPGEVGHQQRDDDQDHDRVGDAGRDLQPP